MGALGKEEMAQEAMKHAILIAFLVLGAHVSGGTFLGDPVSAGKITVIIVLDNSGSMEASDPDGLRFTGARMFLSLLDAGDSAGVILFSTESVPLTEDMVTIERENDKVALLKQLRERAPDGYTDVRMAFLSVDEWLGRADPVDGSTYVIFLTDGKPDIPNMPAGYEEETIQLARSWNIPVLSIALTSSAQTPFLDRLARETGGRVVPANHAADLLDAYLNILGQIKDRTVLKASPDDLSFFLDPGLVPYVDKTSFIFSSTGKDGARLRSPGGGMISPNDERTRFYFSEPGFAVFTIGAPSSGNWQFITRSQGEFKAYAILHSRLRMEMIAPGARHQQSKPMLIEVRMTEEMADSSQAPIIGDSIFTAFISVPDGAQESLDLFYDDGTHGDRQAGDGTFSRLYFNTSQAGIYAIEVKGRKADVPVDYRGEVEVISFPRLTLQEPVGVREYGGVPIRIRALVEAADDFPLEGDAIIASITSPSGEIQAIPLIQEDGGYSADYSPKEEGIHQVQVSGRNLVYRGLPYEETASSQFEVRFRRTLGMEAGEWISNGCFDERGHIPVHLRVFSPDPTPIEFRISGADGLQPYPALVNAGGGLQEFLLKVTSPSGVFPHGIHQFRLEAASSSEFDLEPGPALFSFEVPNVYQRCEPVFKWGGLAGVIFGLITFVAVRKVRAGAQPALVTGTLRYWQVNPTLASPSFEHDLNPFSKTTILVGSASDCDIPIPDHGLEARHFTLTAEKSSDGIQVVLAPIGEIHRGYTRVIASVVLRHGDMFRINDLNFQYLSDSGE
jgi:hypothetical protein